MGLPEGLEEFEQEGPGFGEPTGQKARVREQE